MERSLFPSRERARAAVMAGQVQVGGQTILKPGTLVDTEADITINGPALPYVSRGGLKLQKAIEEFGINFNGMVVLDVGASTGGFTDCALQHGAHKVYALDVGHGLLDWTLRSDPRIVLLEKVNVRYLDPEMIPEKADIVTVDVSFISLLKTLGPITAVMKKGAQLIALVKPQFEVGRHQVGKHGVVKDASAHCEVLLRVAGGMRASGLCPWGLTFSPIRGPKGNIEFLVAADYLADRHRLAAEAKITEVVQQSHKLLLGE